ncbi:mucin-2-like [Dermacentor albipictus]|uniref:mucin-2-like n=1 Tax=Dermacentor albipictus TaxID=60249 RepID=UPI0031FC4B79
MKSRSRTTSSPWAAGVKRPTSPSIRSPKTPSNVVVTTPLAPAQIIIQGGWTPSGLAVNVARPHSRSIASSHDSELSMPMNDATGSRSVEARFPGLPSLPESNKSTEFNGSWKSPFDEIQPRVRSSKSATVKRPGVATASPASAAKGALSERHSELAAFPADSPIKNRAAFPSSDSATSLGKRRNAKMAADAARGLLGQTGPEMAIPEQHEKLSKKRHAPSATSRPSISKTPRTSQASFASPLRQDSQELVSQGSHPTLPLTSPGPHIAEVTIAPVEINPIVQDRGGFRPSSPESYPDAHSAHHKSALAKLLKEYPMDFAKKQALARARRGASKNSPSVLTQPARGRIAKLKKPSETELSKSGKGRQPKTLASPKSSREAFTKPKASTQQSPIKGAPTVAEAQQTPVVMQSAATSPFAEREVEMKSAITTLSPREAVSAPADTVLPLKADTSSPLSGQSVLGTPKTSTGSQEKPTQVSASVTKSPTESRPDSPKLALSAYRDAISPPQSPEPWSPRATAGFLDATKSPRPDYRSPSPRSGQGVPGSLNTSTGAQKISTPVSASAVTKTPTGSRPGSPKGALSEYPDAILPHYSPELRSPRATVGLLDATKSPRPDAPSAPQVSKSPFGSEASAERAIVERASPITDMEPKDGLIRPDIMPASTTDKSPALTAASPSLQVAEASSPRTPQSFSEVAKTTAIAHPESSRVSGSQPGSPVVASALEPWSPRASSGFLDPTKSTRESLGASPSATQGGQSSQPWSPRATSGALDPTKSPLRKPGTSPQASQGAQTPEPLSPRAAPGFLDQTKSPLKRPGTSPQVPQSALSPEPYWRQAEPGFLDSTKSPLKRPGTSPQVPQSALSPEPYWRQAEPGFLDSTKSHGTSPQASQGAKSPEPCSPRAASSLLDSAKSPLERPGTSPQVPQSALSPEPYWRQAEPGFLDSTKSHGTSPQASQGAKSPEPCSPRAASSLLDSAKSPLERPGTSPQVPQSALSPEPYWRQAEPGFLDSTKSHGTSPQASQGAKSPEPCSPRAASSLLDSAKSPLERPGTSPQVPQSALSPEPYWRQAEPGFLDSTKSHGTSPQASQGAKSPEPCSPRATSGLLDSTKSPRKSPGTSPQASQDSIYPVADSYSQVKQLEPWSPKATSGTLDSTKSPRLAVQPSPPASNGNLQQTSLQQIQSPQPPVGPLSEIKSPLTPSSQVSASISKLESVQQLVNPSSTIMEIITTEKTFDPAEYPVTELAPTTEKTFEPAEHPVTELAPSPSYTHVPLDTVKSPSQSSSGSPRRALNALGPASPTPTSGLVSPSEVERLLEAKGSPTSFSPQKGSELKVPSGPLVTAQTTDSEQKASAGGSPQLTTPSAVEKSPRAESPSGSGLAEPDKEKSSVAALTQAAGTGTGVEGHQPIIRASAEPLTPSSKSPEEPFSPEQIIDARQLEADTSAEVIESPKSGDKSVALPVEKRASADIVAAVPSDSGVASAEKSAITSPESDAKGSPQKKKGKKGQKGRKVPKGSTASSDDDSLPISEHIAQAVTESPAQFADIPLQVNMTIDLVPPKSTSSTSSVRTIVSPVHIEKKMIVESCKDGHVEVKIPPVFIDTPEGKHTSDSALNVCVSVDVGKQATQGHKTPEQECRPAEKPWR